MSGGNSTIKVSVIGDEGNLKKTLGQATDDVETFGGKATGAFGKAGAVMTGVLGAGAVTAIANVGGELIGLGNQLKTMGDKADVVFGGSIGDMKAWADDVNGSMGQSKQAVLGMATSMADLLKPMGFTEAQAGEMSKTMIGAAGALSAWSSGKYDAAEVSDIMTKAMLGETDGLKALGIAISADEVSARLLSKGQKDLTGNALAQAKALATQELIMEKSTDAQKAWNDGTMDSVKHQNEAKAKLEDLRATIALKLVPAFNMGVEILTGKVIPALTSVGGFVADNKELFLALGIGITIALVPAFLAWAAASLAAAAGTLAAIAPVVAVTVAIAALVLGVKYAYEHWGWFKAAVDGVADGLGWFWNSTIKPFANWLTDDFTGKLTVVGRVMAAVFTGGLSEVALLVHRHWDDIVGFVTGLPGRIGGAASGMWDGIKDSFRASLNWIIDGWNGLSFRLPEVDTHIPGVGKVGGWSLDTPNITRLATGGIAMARTGGSVVNIGEGGRDEAVVPLPRNWRNGSTAEPAITIHINGNVYGLDDLDRKLEDSIARLKRRGSPALRGA